jgi:hypothetical protein
VVADAVPPGRHFASQRGTLPNELADHEEGGAHAMAVKQVEELRGDGGIRAIVEGERELAGRRRAAKSRAEKL